MSTPLRVAAFVTALAAAFALAWGAGRVAGPIETEPDAHEGEAGHGDARGHEDAGHGGGPSAVAEASGLTARADGFALVLADREPAAGRTRLDVRILTSSGRPPWTARACARSTRRSSARTRATSSRIRNGLVR